MATRSVIAKHNDNGVGYTGIYCHWDGATHLPILKKHYKKPEQVDALIELGSLSVLGKTLGDKQDFAKPAKDACLAYHRDRGEEYRQIHAISEDELRIIAGDCGAEYLYRYFGQTWFVEKL